MKSRYFESEPEPGTLEADPSILLALIIEDWDCAAVHAQPQVAGMIGCILTLALPPVPTEVAANCGPGAGQQPTITPIAMTAQIASSRRIEASEVITLAYFPRSDHHCPP